MNVEKTIQEAMINCPSFFHSRTQVLHHIFFVIGNGYEWCNGEIVEREGLKTKLDYYKRKKNLELWQIKRDRTYKKLSKFFKRNPLVCEVMEIELSNLYPISSCSLIMNIPDDVKKDWWEAAVQAMNDYKRKCTKEDNEKLTNYLLTRKKEISSKEI